MALRLTQQRIQRSMYEAIRRVAVEEGYWPDEVAKDYDGAQKNQWEPDLKTIKDIKGFTIEPLGNSSIHNKGQKLIPRISIKPRKFLEGDIGCPTNQVDIQSPINPDLYQLVVTPMSSVHMQLDVILDFSTDAQEVILNALLHEAIGIMNFLPWYDNPEERFFIKQYNYYDLEDTIADISSKVYSYQVNDVYLQDDIVIENTSPIKTIELETFVASPQPFGPDNNYQSDGTLIIPFVGF